MNQCVYVLDIKSNSRNQRGAGGGVYSSLEELSSAVDYTIKWSPNALLTYRKFELNTGSQQDRGWGHIPIKSYMSDLKRGGQNIPFKSFWGYNLVGLNWIGHNEISNFRKGDVVYYIDPNGQKRSGVVFNKLASFGEDGKKFKEPWVRWSNNGGLIALELLLLDLRLNQIELQKL